MSAARVSHLLASAAFAAAAPALAEAPRVVADIAPIHSIAAAVMAGVGAPALIVPPGVSEHDYALRPSEATALEAADLVVWVGPALTPWLEEAVAALAPDALLLTLQAAQGVRLLPVREGGPFEGHDEDHADDEDHAESDTDDHPAEAVEAGHGDNQAARAGDKHDADAGATDPHFWLDPQGGTEIAAALSGALSEVDPANAAAYAANAATFGAEMEALAAEIAEKVQPLRNQDYFVFHDAYQYFEDRFALPAAGSVALNDAEPPRAPRIAEIRERFTNESIDCVFAEPQFEPKLIATLIEGTTTRTGTLDPLGAGLEPGPGLYPALLRGLADDLVACLDPQS